MKKTYTKKQVIKLMSEAWNKGAEASRDSRKYGEYTPFNTWIITKNIQE
jgi:hypothetical protein